MKVKDLARHLRLHGCRIARQGRSHTIWQNPINNKKSAVGRHKEIPFRTALAICEQLEVPKPEANR